ncbi:MAG: histone deacetylase family protein, partial [Proteobacteria bacterium]|nr:histone deacetylase family protein [Pseudomonadota bacterium]
MTIIFTHQSAEDHDPGPGHPERSDRIRAVMQVLNSANFADLERRESPVADIDQIALIHRREYIKAALDAVPAEGYARIDPDTVLSPATGDAALRSVGAAIAAVDAVMAGETTN